jgi:alkaline phosphatase D
MLDLSKLDEAVRYEGGISRRLFLAYAASLSAVPWLGRTACAKPTKSVFHRDPFRLGVASGDPSASSIVLWTRLAPDPLEPAGGMDPQFVNVTCEVATDDAMRHVVRRGGTTASPQLAHSVHIEVENLEPDRWYWYRFRAGDAESPIGRTRTIPAEDSSPSELRMAFASCANFETGLFTAYDHMAKEELDLVVHLGDYIYEHGKKGGQLRKHIGVEARKLDEYRMRFSQYKNDPMLQAIHARCPWIVTWDDHEVCNDYSNDRAEKERETDPVKFLARRAAAYQAYYENMPLRHTSLPRGPQMQMYRKMSFGQLAELLVLDGRQYRTPQPNDDKPSNINDAARSPKNTMLGKRQFGWLTGSLAESPATWNVLANQVIMATLNELPDRVHGFAMDDWSGYVHERNKLMQFIKERKIANPVVITGDNHKNWVNDLHVDDLRPKSPVVATEFVGTSITSGGNGGEHKETARKLLAKNPASKFYNDERGYVRCTITPGQWRSDFRTVSDILKPGAPVITRASFIVEAGKAGAMRA